MKAARSLVRTNPTSATAVVAPTQIQKHGRSVEQGSLDRNDDNFEMTKSVSNSIELISLRSKLAYLPVQFKFTCGNKTIIDYIKDDEAEEVYNLFTGFADVGDGFGMDEFDNLNDFKKKFIKDAQAVCARDTKTNKLLAIISISPAAFCRSVKPPVADAYILLNPNFRGKGAGTDLLKVCLTLMRDLGYKGILTDTFLTNVRMFSILKKLGFNTVAYIPNGAQVKGVGWTDMIIQFKEFNENWDCFAQFNSIKANL